MATAQNVLSPGKSIRSFGIAITGKPMKDYDDGDSLVQYLLLVQAEITRHYNVLLSTKEYVTAEDVKRSYKGIKEKVVMLLEIINGSSFYEIHGDTLALKFKGSEFSSPGCCNYDVNREFKIHQIDNSTIKLVKLRDLD